MEVDLMNLYQITPIEDSQHQSLSMDLQVGKETLRVELELIYMEKTDLWYMNLTDLQTEQSYLRMVPLLASYGEINNLWKPFAHKNIGMLYCYPATDEPSTQNPSKDNLNEFVIVWGDEVG